MSEKLKELDAPSSRKIRMIKFDYRSANNMKIGYARVSTLDQNLDRQVEETALLFSFYDPVSMVGNVISHLHKITAVRGKWSVE
jgi:predicted site-specific integrase-resolvase